MKYFLTGATGFIGGRMARRLIADGHQVAALVRDPSKAEDLAALGVTVSQGDVTNRESMRAPMSGCDGVFHMAAWYKLGVRDSRDAVRINVDGTRKVLELMRELGIPKGVYTSTLAVFGDTRGKVVDEAYRHDGPWLSVYDETKWRAHYEVVLPMIEQGLPLIVVQPGVNYGPGDTSSIRRTFIQYLTRKLPMIPSVAAYCWAHVDDTVQGHLLAMERGKPGETYIIAGPQHSLVGVFELAERLTGIPAPKTHPDPATMRAMASVMSVLEKVFPVPETYASETLRVLAGATYLGSSAKAEREIGFKPRPLEAGLAETLKVEQELLKGG